MTIVEIVKQGFYYARTCKSLWLFGFFLGLAASGGSGGAGGSSTGGNANSGGLPTLAGALGIPFPVIAAIGVLAVTLVVAAILMRFVSEGALIEGVAQAHRGGRLTTAQGFRAGWAHWGVLLRIALLYFAAVAGSLVLLIAPCVMAIRMGGLIAALGVALPAMVIAVPWLVTLYLIQAFASRIAVLENRHALDAIAKARLFLHGRLRHALRTVVAMLIGSLAVGLVAIMFMVPVVLVFVMLMPVLSVWPVITMGVLVLLPAMYVLTAILGTFRSSVWTIGYLTEVES